MTPPGPLKNQALGNTAEIQEEPVSDCSLICSLRIILQQGCRCWQCPTITLSVRGNMGPDQLHVPAIHSRFVFSCDRLDFQRARPRTAMSTLDVQLPITTCVFAPSNFCLSCVVPLLQFDKLILSKCVMHARFDMVSWNHRGKLVQALNWSFSRVSTQGLATAAV